MGLNRSMNRNTPYTRQFTFAGNLFDVYFKFLAIPAGGTVFLELRTGTTRIFHGIARNLIPSGGPTNYILLENPTIVTPGAISIPTIQTNRNLTKTSQATIFRGTTGVSGGTTIEQLFYPVGTGANSAPTSTLTSEVERIYKLNTKYTFAITNNGNSAIDVLYNLSFYETEN
jgi:hypothetical protein